MLRVFTWAGFGGVVGFAVFFKLFGMFAPQNNPDSLLWDVFAIMAAIPVAAVGAVFGAVLTILEKLREMRQDMMQGIEELITIQDQPSTQVKSGRPILGSD
jgi:hypothetical protein